jgi:hypothetical protein
MAIRETTHTPPNTTHPATPKASIHFSTTGRATQAAIDRTTPSGCLLFHALAAIAEFERDLMRDRVVAGLRRAKAQAGGSVAPVGITSTPTWRAHSVADGLSLRGRSRIQRCQCSAAGAWSASPESGC